MKREMGKFVFPVFVSFLILTAFTSVSEAKTIYVPDDYARIQWAVDNASAGDTIIVRDGIYYESITVSKQLTIKSENGPENCIVNGSGSDVFTLEADGIRIEGFTITGGGYGIFLWSDNNSISNNIISSNNYDGIFLWGSDGNNISNNIIRSNNDGIFLDHSNNNSISNNNISSNNFDGIGLVLSNNNIIYLNNFINNTYNARSYTSTNIWNSKEQIKYTYKGSKFENYMGNYWDNYTGSDENGDGIGDIPYSINTDEDKYPLIEHFENYLAAPTPTPTLTEECKKYIAKYLGESPEPNKYCFTDTIATTVQYWTVIDEEQWGSTLDAVVTIVIFEGYSYEDKVNKTGKIDAEKLKEKNGGTALTEDDLDWIRTHSNGKDKFCYTEVATPTFDTGRPENPYPSISGKFIGTIKANTKIIAKKLYTYACEGTGGHTEYALIWNKTWCAYAEWEGYKGDWMNISFNRTVVLMPYETYNITIVTGSYPQIHHTPSLKTENGWINCTEFIDANGNKYNDWIPAIMLWS